MIHNKIILFVLSFVLLGVVSSHAQNIGGIGAMLAIDSSGDSRLPVIRNILPNSPAAGTLKENLFILKVNDVSCKNKTIEEVVGLIRGAVGTHVKLQAADNKEGKHTIDYDLVRAVIQQPPSNSAGIDPVTAFNTWCEAEVKLLRRKEHEIVKTFESECGNYFFNFNASEPGIYHTRMYTLEDKSVSASFAATASVADANNEADAKTLAKGSPYLASWGIVTTSQGDIQIKRPGVGLISVKITPLTQEPKCKALFIAVYK